MRSRCHRQLADALERTQQTSLLRRIPLTRSCARRTYATATATQEVRSDSHVRTLAVPSNARHNEIGVQQVSAYVHPQLFPSTTAPKPTEELVALSKDHLARHELLGKTSDTSEPIGFDLPALHGSSLDEHFYRLGMDSAEPFLSMATKFARASPPSRPRKWVQRSGWTKYHEDGTSEAVDYPNAEVLTFDTEVMWRETSFPAMACAVSDRHWYAWLSPWLLRESENDRHLIPLGPPTRQRVVVGHNIGYDRARIAEEYSLEQSQTFFVDTMSLHVATNGMCSRQRPTWNKHKKERDLQDKIAASDDSADLAALLESGKATFDSEEELWVGRASVNSLRDVAKFHCNITIDKARREWFGELDRDGVVERLDELLDYCAADVDITHKVYKKVLPLFLETSPHPVSFAALRHLSTEILPVNKSWQSYIANAEATYHGLSSGVQERLIDLTERAVAHREDPTMYQNDPWLSQLDWRGQEVRMVKGKKKGDPARPAARQKKPGMPNWYKDLFSANDSEIALTVRTRIAPLLLRMAWDGRPLIWSDKYGFTLRVPNFEANKYRDQGMTACDMMEEENLLLHDDLEHTYFKLPHKDGPDARCTSPLAKGYLQYFENGTLSSEYAYAKEALEMNASCSYWISARDRIMSQMVVYESEKAASSSTDAGLGYILPQVIPMGTITRRAVENTWLTAANAKKNRVGSELKSMVTAPPGYCFVGADVDSQELWIASLVGDSSFKIHGGNAIGFMTLEGTKAAGTDLHSRTAKILGISRNDAKVFNYGRIYGAGLKFAQSLLRQFNPSVTEEQAKITATNLYQETKGAKSGSKAIRDRKFWRGGTESLVFNKLEDFAEQERPRTPVLGAGITEALMRRFISKGGFMTSRINWAIQSSGVDYLHLLIVSMEYLCKRYNITARLALTVHDEIRYLSEEKDKYRTAMALQVANVWTRAMFSQQMGIDDLPQSCAYFSAVDIDHVLRKEVDMDCVTPSHPEKIRPGESLDITQLLAKGEQALLDPAEVPLESPQPERFEYTPRRPVMEGLPTPNAQAYLRAQIASSSAELNKIVRDMKRPVMSKSSSSNDTDGNDGGSRPAKSTKAKTAPKPRGRKPASTKTTSNLIAKRNYTSLPPLESPFQENAFINAVDWADFGNDVSPSTSITRSTLASTPLGLGMIRKLPFRQPGVPALDRSVY
ncbi:Putative DNA-directed DNA polymerase, family A, palm domain, ribonuclease H-like superfamily [Septoria linicola]|uniref:DNA-directed DNA polymerase n=1 Tax=Septoria linicola TaxID=215465 RepID=A0A9Q9APD4_9PEZI|nr:putative DNA-directed DNA polymerase, family A, palm domain, ribonuclease H-like superfamily [Septoria linicola]USW49641.1 Putative DNA-directed DNA polymerase, family A, palm domain, ribonuclease H-like superfamily [Septoria linicola]